MLAGDATRACFRRSCLDLFFDHSRRSMLEAIASGSSLHNVTHVMIAAKTTPWATPTSAEKR